MAAKLVPVGSDGDTAAFEREAAILQSCRDRNIVQFLGAVSDGTQLMLVTECASFSSFSIVPSSVQQRGCTPAAPRLAALCAGGARPQQCRTWPVVRCRTRSARVPAGARFTLSAAPAQLSRAGRLMQVHGAGRPGCGAAEGRQRQPALAPQVRASAAGVTVSAGSRIPALAGQRHLLLRPGGPSASSCMAHLGKDTARQLSQKSSVCWNGRPDLTRCTSAAGAAQARRASAARLLWTSPAGCTSCTPRASCTWCAAPPGITHRGS